MGKVIHLWVDAEVTELAGVWTFWLRLFVSLQVRIPRLQEVLAKEGAACPGCEEVCLPLFFGVCKAKKSQTWETLEEMLVKSVNCGAYSSVTSHLHIRGKRTHDWLEFEHEDFGDQCVWFICWLKVWRMFACQFLAIQYYCCKRFPGAITLIVCNSFRWGLF